MKTVSILPALVLLVLIFCLHICFSLSLTVSKHHNFFLSTYELAKSSHVVVFFIFNVIVILVFFGSSKSSSTFKEDHCDCYSISVPNSSAYEVDSYDYISEDEEDEEYQYHGYDGYDKDDENDDEDDDDDDDDASYYVFNSDDEYGGEDKDSDSDQLERRIEEFIAKMNCKWREELRYEKLKMICS